jgi:hypothetical protein
VDETEEAVTAPTVERVLDVMAEVVAEYGEDHVYQPPDLDYYKCLYVHHGRPSCLLAHVLARLGVPLEVLAGMEGKDAAVVARKVWGSEASGMLQDDGGTWGEALAKARLVAAEYAA